MSAKLIKDLLSNYLEGSSLNEINETINIEKIWKIIVGKTISINTKIISLKKGILIIKVSRPAWRNELSFQKEELITKINKAEPEIHLSEIIFR